MKSHDDPTTTVAAVRAVRGKRAEQVVEQYLREVGFAIVARNLRLGRLELDVVARKEDLVVVVEVRSRGDGAWTTGLGSLDRAKRRRIRRAGERLWARRYRHDPSVARMRFDAASVRLEVEPPEVDYVMAAF